MFVKQQFQCIIEMNTENSNSSSITYDQIRSVKRKKREAKRDESIRKEGVIF